MRGERPQKRKAWHKQVKRFSPYNGDDDGGGADLSASTLAAAEWHGENKGKSMALEGGDFLKYFRCPQANRKNFKKYYPSIDFPLSATAVCRKCLFCKGEL